MRNLIFPTCCRSVGSDPEFIKPNPYTDIAEVDILLTAISLYENPVVLEIGTNLGRTADNIGRFLKKVHGRLLTVDVMAPGDTLPEVQRGEVLNASCIGSEISDELIDDGTVRLKLFDPNLPHGLHDVLAKYLSTNYAPKFDVVFMDGDHSCHGVCRDIGTVYCYLKEPDGIIFLHDVWWDQDPPEVEGPLRFLEEAPGFYINATHVGITGHHAKILLEKTNEIR